MFWTYGLKIVSWHIITRRATLSDSETIVIVIVYIAIKYVTIWRCPTCHKTTELYYGLWSWSILPGTYIVRHSDDSPQSIHITLYSFVSGSNALMEVRKSYNFFYEFVCNEDVLKKMYILINLTIESFYKNKIKGDKTKYTTSLLRYWLCQSVSTCL